MVGLGWLQLSANGLAAAGGITAWLRISSTGTDAPWPMKVPAPISNKPLALSNGMPSRCTVADVALNGNIEAGRIEVMSLSYCDDVSGQSVLSM